MRSNFLVILFLLFFLGTGCTNSKLSNQEQELVGAWNFEINSSPNGNRNFKYLELGPSRIGVNGIGVEVNGKAFLGTSFEIKQWRLNGDTLVIDYIMTGGRFSGPGRKDTVINDYPVRDLWIIKQKMDNEFVAENYDPSIPFSSDVRFVRTEALKGR